jgi:hypothetical protein
MSRKPNFFIVGAQRCGTTSLSQYLAAHDQIFLSAPKEPYYFATDIPRLRRMDTDEEYLRLFESASPEIIAMGEATAGYLYSKCAVDNIFKFAPDAKIVVMLRNPVDLVASFHSHLVFSYYETEVDLLTAWNLQEHRRKGNNIPRGCRVPSFLQYGEVGKIGEQVERLFRIFPRKQVYLGFFEDFTADTRAFYVKILEFLGVPDDGRTDFPRLNSNKKPRFRRISGLFTPRPMWIQKSIDSLKSGMGIRGQKLIQRLYAVPEKRKVLPSEYRDKLSDFFLDDIALISSLSGRNLDHWKDRPEPVGKK